MCPLRSNGVNLLQQEAHIICAVQILQESFIPPVLIATAQGTKITPALLIVVVAIYHSSEGPSVVCELCWIAVKGSTELAACSSALVGQCACCCFAERGAALVSISFNLMVMVILLVFCYKLAVVWLLTRPSFCLWWAAFPFGGHKYFKWKVGFLSAKSCSLSPN